MIKSIIESVVDSVIRPVVGNDDGGIQPPSGFVAQYLAYYISDFSFGVNNQIQTWSDRSVNANDLTQNTSGSQPKLIEQDIVTQYTVANQPTYDYDKIVRQSTPANRPTWNGVDAIEFNDSRLDGLPANQTNFTYEIDFESSTFGSMNTSVLANPNGSGSNSIRTTSGGSLRIRWNEGGSDTLASFNLQSNIRYKLVLRKTANTWESWINDIFQGTIDGTGLTCNISSMGFDGGESLKVYSYRSFNQAVSDPTNIVETPDFELLAQSSDLLLENGNEVAGWKATGATEVVKFDDNGDNINLPSPLTLNTDFTLELTLDLSNTNIAYFLNKDINTALLIMASANSLRFYATDNSFTSFNTGGLTGVVAYKFVKSGNNISAYQNGSQIGATQDVTGKQYDFQGLGRGTGGNNPFKVKSFKLWNSSDDSGEPDFTLTPSDEYILTGSGNPVSKWYAEQHNKFENRVEFDGVNDYMEGLPVPANDFTYVFVNINLSSTQVSTLLGEPIATGSGRIIADNTNNRITVVSNEGGIFSFNNFTQFDEDAVIVIKLTGTNLEVFVNNVSIDGVKDFTGNTLAITTISRDVSQWMNGKNTELWLYDRGLSQSEIDFFNYERDVFNNIQLDENGNPQLPV